MTFERTTSSTLRLALGATALTLIGSVAQADQVILDDLIVDGSICAGFDCVNGESFGFDTLRLKENNLRIKAQDTSTSASFPTNDWQITFNETSNGGANKFSIDDIDGGRTPFTLEAGAPSHSLYVDDGGRIGFGTSSPVVELHLVDGDTPTLRLEQDGSSGFTPQTWDLAGNETNFFIRDVTNGSKLPFRSRPGAPTSSIDIAASGDVGLGDSSPTADLDITRSGTRVLVEYETTGGTATVWNLVMDGDGTGTQGISFTRAGTGAREFRLEPDGDLFITGTLTTAGNNYPDYVFAPDYELMPLNEVGQFIAENGHLPKIPTEAEVMKNGMNISEMQVALLEKVEELTLYTLEQQRTIEDLQTRLNALAD